MATKVAKRITIEDVPPKCTVNECQNLPDAHTTISVRGGEDKICKACKRLRKACNLCEGILLRTEFSPDSRMKDGFYGRCKQCMKLLKRGYSAELIRKNFPRIDEDGIRHSHCMDSCDTELAMGKPNDDCNCQLCTDSRTGKLLT